MGALNRTSPFRPDQFEQSLLNARKESDSGTLTHIKFFHRLLHRIARLRKRYTHGKAVKSFCEGELESDQRYVGEKGRAYKSLPSKD